MFLSKRKKNAVAKEIDLTRAKWLPGDIFTVKAPHTHYQTITVTNLLHHWSTARCIEFFSKMKQLLRKDGYLIIVDICPPEAPYSVWEGATMARSFSHMMLVWSKKGKAYSSTETAGMLSQAGFRTVQEFPIFPFMTGIVAQAKIGK